VCVNPTQVYVNPTQVYVNATQVYVNATQVCVNPTQVLGAALLSLLRVGVFNPTCVPSASMQPTLSPGDCVLVEVVSTKLAATARGEVVVFRPPPASRLAGMTRWRKSCESQC
jgi:signal peptidase I